MKIAYIGNFRPIHSTENHLKKTLENLGHEVDPLQENGMIEAQMIQRSLKSDMVMFTRTWGTTVTNNFLDVMRHNKIPTVSYHLDLYIGLKRDGNIDTDPFWRTDYVFTPDGGHEDEFKAKGINHRYIKPAVFRPECYMAPFSGEYKHDVLFVGSWLNYHPEWPYRRQLVDFLKRNYGDRLGLYGYTPDTTVRNDELNQLYRHSKVVVGDSLCLGFKHPHYWSDRVYETLGRGGFMIHPWIEGMDDEFEDGKHLKFYGFNDWAELKYHIDWYIKHDEQRERIRNAGHEFVRESATYDNRMTEMLRVLRQEGVIRD